MNDQEMHAMLLLKGACFSQDKWIAALLCQRNGAHRLIISWTFWIPYYTFLLLRLSERVGCHHTELCSVSFVVASNAVAPPSASPAAPSEPLSLQLAPVLGSVIGICSALIISAVIIALIVRLREKNVRRRNGSHVGRHHPANEHDSKASVPLHISSHCEETVDLHLKAPQKSREGKNESFIHANHHSLNFISFKKCL